MQQVQSWYRVACVFLLTVHDVETLSETTFLIQRLHGNQNAFYPIHMSLLYGQMFGNDVSFYKYVWLTADWYISYSILIGIDGCLFYITLALYFRKRFLRATTGLVCKRYRGRLWSKRRVYWRQRSISRAKYVQLARDRSLPHLPHRKSCGNEKCSLSQLSRVVICHVEGTLKQVRDYVRNLRLPLLIGPQFSSDPSADGPDKKGEDKLPIHEETDSSDTKSDLPESRPSTPTKPRGMSKRNYKNLVRKHRKQYPRVTTQTSSAVHKESDLSTRESNDEIKTKKRSKAQRNIEKAALMLKRRLQGSKARSEEMMSQRKRRHEKGSEDRGINVLTQKKRRQEKGREDRGKDVVTQKKRRKKRDHRVEGRRCSLRRRGVKKK